MVNTEGHPVEEDLEGRAELPALGRVISLSETVASRRGFIKSGLAASSIVLSVVNRSAWADDKATDKDAKHDGQDGKGGKGRRRDGLTESAAASSTHLSHHPRRA